MVEFEHDWALASALIERWRPESHTFYLLCGEMTITLQDIAYQLGLRIDSDPVSGCIGGWEQHHRGRTIEEICEQLLGVVPSPDDRQSQTKWTLIGGILFSDASDSRVHIRWLPLLKDLERCGRLSWGSAAYHRILLIRSNGFDTRRFPLLERRVQYRPDNATGESRLRHYRRILNGIGMLNVEWTPYADPQLIGIVPPVIAEAEASWAVVCPLFCFAIVEWHQVDRVVHQFSGLQHIPTRPLNIDDMHRLDGRFGRGEWFPQLLDGWHELWDARVHHHLPIYHHIDLRPSLAYMTWYLQWAHTELFGLGDQHLVAAEVVPEDLPMHHPLAPDLHQPDDGHLTEMRPAAGGGRGRGGGEPRGEVGAVLGARGRVVRPATETWSSTRRLLVTETTWLTPQPAYLARVPDDHSSGSSSTADYATLREQMSTPAQPPVPPVGRGLRDIRPPPCGMGGYLDP
ncbi:uncharacterized protein DS421_14g454110 [Arachis hypogaea]|nr:uncharacterized protein DS421_14g454110 [Arachis hypogaea]